MIVKEIYKDGVLQEKQYFKKEKSASQVIVLGIMLLSIFAMVASKTILSYYDAELPLILWIVESIAPCVSCIMFAIYEAIR